MPKVSVVIPSFNHTKYINECIQSVLDQTFHDFEILITDDGSSDNSLQMIREFKDPRIHLDVFPINRGACPAVNNCIRQASGQYIAVLSSDDAWEPTKLEKQVAFLDTHPEIGAVFTRVLFIDETSRLIESKDNIYFHVFDQGNRTKEAWLNYFFYRGNCLCHPSLLIRTSCYDEVGLYDERMASLPDFDMWVRVCLKYQIHILDEKLVRFRLMQGETNASGNRPSNHIRIRFESLQIYQHYLKINDKDMFIKVFPEATRYGSIESKYIPYFLGRLAIDVPSKTCQFWGLEVLNSYMERDQIGSELERNYGFRYTDLYRLTAQYDVFNIFPVISQQISMQKRGKLLKSAFWIHQKLSGMVRRYIIR